MQNEQVIKSNSVSDNFTQPFEYGASDGSSVEVEKKCSFRSISTSILYMPGKFIRVRDTLSLWVYRKSKYKHEWVIVYNERKYYTIGLLARNLDDVF